MSSEYLALKTKNTVLGFPQFRASIPEVKRNQDLSPLVLYFCVIELYRNLF